MAAPSGETKRGAAIDWRLKAKNLHRGSPETGVSKHQLQRSPIRFKGRADPSHIYLNSDRGPHEAVQTGFDNRPESHLAPAIHPRQTFRDSLSRGMVFLPAHSRR